MKNEKQGNVSNISKSDDSQALNPAAVPQSKEITRVELANSIFDYLDDFDSDSKKRQCVSSITRWLSQKTNRYGRLLKKYLVVYLCTDRLLDKGDADEIYRTIFKIGRKEQPTPIFLLLNSRGGYIGPAYLLGKILQEYSCSQLEIAVPRQAKSAATLLCCAATHIHMGSLSELGPIDPQTNDGPALGLKTAIQHLAELSVSYPKAVDLFIGYMSNKIEPISLGYYERVVESSMQYAERLLKIAHADYGDNQIQKIARRLTYEYKDHGFVIDKHEAAEVFGKDMICSDSEEYDLSNELYKAIRFIERCAKYKNYDFIMVGSGVDAPKFMPRK